MAPLHYCAINSSGGNQISSNRPLDDGKLNAKYYLGCGTRKCESGRQPTYKTDIFLLIIRYQEYYCLAN